MRFFLALVLGLTAAAQTQPRSFEVASIKPPARPNDRNRGVYRGGPGTTSPGEILIRNMPLRNIILNAYGLKEFQLTGPAWLDSERYDITAKVPAGATKADAALMLQELLAQRFKLVVHREHKEIGGYAMVVDKGGPKFKESPPAPAGAEGGDASLTGPLEHDKEGYPILPPGRPAMVMDSAMYGGAHTATGALQSMSDLASTVARELGKPIEDGTGLTGKYSFRLHWMSEYVPPPGSDQLPSTPDGPDLPAALLSQLGLKLEARKVPTEIVVVDHAEKAVLDN